MKAFFTLIFIGLASISMAQSNTSVTIKDTVCNKHELFEWVEQMPAFKGGTSQLVQKLNDQLNLDTSLKGQFVLDLKINCRGKIFDIMVRKGIDDSMNNQVLNAILASGDWLSGKQNGHPIDCKITLILNVIKGKFII